MPTHLKMSLAEMRDRSPSNGGGDSTDVHSQAYKTACSTNCELEAEKQVVEEVRETVSEELREIDMMTKQIKAITMRLDEQQRKHELEQLQARQEIDGLKGMMTQIVQVIGSLRMPGLKEKVEEQTENSSTSTPRATRFDHEPTRQLLAEQPVTGEAQSELHQLAKGKRRPVFPTDQEAQAKDERHEESSSSSMPRAREHDHSMPEERSLVEQALTGDVQSELQLESAGSNSLELIKEKETPPFSPYRSCKPYSLKKASNEQQMNDTSTGYGLASETCTEEFARALTRFRLLAATYEP